MAEIEICTLETLIKQQYKQEFEFCSITLKVQVIRVCTVLYLVLYLVLCMLPMLTRQNIYCLRDVTQSIRHDALICAICDML